ncbi:uncharacterized protein METZ01_LOCUS302911, partial [marine metagenome]
QKLEIICWSFMSFKTTIGTRPISILLSNNFLAQTEG